MATAKHTAYPATASQILSTIQITKKDREIVNKVLAELRGGKAKVANAPRPTAKKTAGKSPAVASPSSARGAKPGKAAARAHASKPPSRKTSK